MTSPGGRLVSQLWNELAMKRCHQREPLKETESGKNKNVEESLRCIRFIEFSVYYD